MIQTKLKTIIHFLNRKCLNGKYDDDWVEIFSLMIEFAFGILMMCAFIAAFFYVILIAGF